jgi:predicted RNA polymerase sigma factor
MFGEEWPREEWPDGVHYLYLIGRARTIEKVRAGCRAKEQDASKQAEIGKNVSGEQWLAEWRSKTQNGMMGSSEDVVLSRQKSILVITYQ